MTGKESFTVTCSSEQLAERWLALLERFSRVEQLIFESKIRKRNRKSAGTHWQLADAMPEMPFFSQERAASNDHNKKRQK